MEPTSSHDLTLIASSGECPFVLLLLKDSLIFSGFLALGAPLIGMALRVALLKLTDRIRIQSMTSSL